MFIILANSSKSVTIGSLTSLGEIVMTPDCKMAEIRGKSQDFICDIDVCFILNYF